MILDLINEKTREDVEKLKKKFPKEWLLGSINSGSSYKPRDVMGALMTGENELCIIAEIKKASPSKGEIRADFDPINLAIEYEKSGANLLSVLVEPHWFKGDVEFITQIRRHTHIPILYKGFVIDEYQVLQAVVYGADMILLIAKSLDKDSLNKLFVLAKSLGLEVLVETHDEADLMMALEIGATVIGINHRDLRTFKMDMSLFDRLAPLVPKGKILVAESGLYERTQLLELSQKGAGAFLIGESFMRQDDVGLALKNIKEG